MRMRPLLGVGAAILLVGTALIYPLAQPAAAKSPRYAGVAPDSVFCSLSAKVWFSPALTDSGGGTSPSTVKGTLSGCTPSNTGVTITEGKVTGSFASSPLSCVTDSTTGASASLSVVWKGSVNGFVDGATYAGKAAFTATTVNGSSATGSFSGNAAIGLDAPSNLATLCEAKNGINKLTLAGAITIGPPVIGPPPTQVVQTIPVGVGPSAVSSDGTHVWVANGSGSSVTELDASTGTVDRTIAVGSGADAISSDGTHVWVTNPNGNSVTELDASTGAVVQTIGVGNFAQAISSDGTHVWVANLADNTVTEIDASTGAVVQTIAVGNGPDAISSDGTHVWVANDGGDNGNTVTELDASTGAVVATIVEGNGPDAISSDGIDVWVANQGICLPPTHACSGNTVTELDASTGVVVQTIVVSLYPLSAISSDGTHVWVTSSDYIGSSAGELDASNGAGVAGFPGGIPGIEGVGNGPDGVSSDGTHAWVANGADDTVTEINELPS